MTELRAKCDLRKQLLNPEMVVEGVQNVNLSQQCLIPVIVENRANVNLRQRVPTL